MSLVTKRILGWVVLIAGCLGVTALAGDRPPRDSRLLEEIVETLEKTGYVVVEAEIDAGRWEVDVYQGNQSYELHIDPVTGKTLSTHLDDANPAPLATAMKLSKLLREVSKGGYSPIVSAKFKHGRWEVEAYKDRVKRELEIEAEDGKVLSDRADD